MKSPIEKWDFLFYQRPQEAAQSIAKWVLASGLAWSAMGAQAQQQLVMASTTSTEQSGLFAHLLPAFKQATGIEVKVVALGTGQAIDMGRRGDADVLFVHDKVAEEKVVSEGYALQRFEVMYNDFVIVGPRADPAAVKGKDVVAALQRISAGNAVFISRGDKSGTHAAELRYWSLASTPKAMAYRECGCGMGQALNMAAATHAYVLTDRGTWLAFKNRADLAVLVEGDKRLFNQYGVMAVNPARHPHVKAAEAQKFVDWVTSATGQASINAYRVGGEQLFFGNAHQRP
jgi:tungstate transport system substrate-binding protein